MSTCNNQLRAEGATSWPRTCSRCGIKKCTHPDFAEKATGKNDEFLALKQIARLMQGLSYRDMRAFSGAIHSAFKFGGAFPPDLIADKLLLVSEEILK